MQNSCHGYTTVSQCIPNETPKGPWPLSDAPLGIQMDDIVLDPGTRGWRHGPRTCPPLQVLVHRPRPRAHRYTYTYTTHVVYRASTCLADFDPCAVSPHCFPPFDIVCSAVGHRLAVLYVVLVLLLAP